MNNANYARRVRNVPFLHSFSMGLFFHRGSGARDRQEIPESPSARKIPASKETVAALLPGTGFVLLYHHLLLLYLFFLLIQHQPTHHTLNRPPGRNNVEAICSPTPTCSAVSSSSAPRYTASGGAQERWFAERSNCLKSSLGLWEEAGQRGRKKEILSLFLKPFKGKTNRVSSEHPITCN